MKIYSLALDAVSAVHEDVSPMLARHDAELANQLHRAIRSVALNVSEGLGLLAGKRQRNHFQIALGSARESKTCIELGLATRALKRNARVERALDRLDHVCAILWKLTRRQIA
ncbi:MAG: four helix bundle protein [Deltaproteobacteria bacterium]|nr:four helix bundle protein [Deltaproteobacteria bacterium]